MSCHDVYRRRKSLCRAGAGFLRVHQDVVAARSRLIKIDQNDYLYFETGVGVFVRSHER